MVDTIEQVNIRGLDIDKTLKGFALTEFVFKNELCTVSSTAADAIRWYQETAADMTATTPSAVANISPLSKFPTLEHSWVRNTSYPKKYGAEVKISMEDIKTADVDVLSRQLLRLTRAVSKQIDTDIWNVITESQSASNINSVTSTAAWDAASGQNCVEDILEAIYDIEIAGYNADDAIIVLSPKDKRSLFTWLITTIGDKIANFASDLTRDGVNVKLFGHKILTNINVTADYAAVIVPGCATWKELTPLTSKVIEDPGIGTQLRVWEEGICILTDPKQVSLISNTQT